MHILVTNDDGIASPGLWALAGALYNAGYGEVTIVAPAHEQSGMSMSLPSSRDLQLATVAPPEAAYGGITAFSLNSTPVACVSATLAGDFCPPPDVVVSGINRGLNTGTSVLLSGTVGAAMIAAVWGLPALALSQQFLGDAPMPWPTAAWAAAQIFPLLEGLRSYSPLVLNVNVPHVHTVAELHGFRQTRLSPFFFGRYVDVERGEIDAEGRSPLHFRFARERVPTFPDSSDDGAVRAGWVSVTALAPNLDSVPIDLSADLARL